MSANSSFSTDTLPLHLECLIITPSSYIYRAYSLTTIFLVLPLCVLILHHGLQEWWKKRSTSTEVTLSHSDSFAYNMAIADLLHVIACTLSYCGASTHDVYILYLVYIIFSLATFGQIFIHLLTCVERYLAVVHPVTYLSLRQERGIRVRNVTIGCVWLLCFALMGFLMIKDEVIIIVNFSLLISSLIITSFCSLSVLRVLTHPGPGEQGGNRQRVDQSKLRAFYTIVTILGMLVLRFFWNLVWTIVYISEGNDGCVLMSCVNWFNIPSNLMLPLLFLHRKGKFVCIE